MIELTKRGFSRERAYSLVQKNAQNAWTKNISLLESLSKDNNVTKKINLQKQNRALELLSYSTAIIAIRSTNLTDS